MGATERREAMTSVPSSQTRIEECQALVHSLASQIHRKLPPYIDREDLIAYGQLGLAEAARDFDPAHGSRFSTFAYYRIRGAIYDGLTKMSWFSRAQYSRFRYERMAGDVLRHEAEEGRQSPAGDGEGEMRHFRNLGQTLAVVYLATHSGPEGESDALRLVDAATPTPPASAIRHEINQKLHEYVDALPQDAANLIRAIYFEGLDLQKAGERLGISKSWASRLHTKTLRRLARDLHISGTVNDA